MDASPFSKLSVELRLRIYDFVLRQPQEIHVGHNLHPGSSSRCTPSFQPSKDLEIWLHRDELTKLPRALAQTCKQIRKEAMERFYAVNRSYTETFVRYDYRGEPLVPQNHPTILSPVLKFIDAAETRCKISHSGPPRLRITVFINDTGLADTNPNHEDPGCYVLRTLLELTRAYNAEGKDIDVIVAAGSRHSGVSLNPSVSNAEQIVIKEGFRCLDRLIEDVQNHVQEDAQVDVQVKVDQGYNGFVRDVKVLKRWQQVFVS